MNLIIAFLIGLGMGVAILAALVLYVVRGME